MVTKVRTRHPNWKRLGRLHTGVSDEITSDGRVEDNCWNRYVHGNPRVI